MKIIRSLVLLIFSTIMLFFVVQLRYPIVLGDFAKNTYMVTENVVSTDLDLPSCVTTDVASYRCLAPVGGQSQILGEWQGHYFDINTEFDHSYIMRLVPDALGNPFLYLVSTTNTYTAWPMVYISDPYHRVLVYSSSEVLLHVSQNCAPYTIRYYACTVTGSLLNFSFDGGNFSIMLDDRNTYIAETYDLIELVASEEVLVSKKAHVGDLILAEHGIAVPWVVDVLYP